MKPTLSCTYALAPMSPENVLVQAEIAIDPPFHGFTMARIAYTIPVSGDPAMLVRERAYWKLKQELGAEMVGKNWTPQEIQLTDVTPKPEIKPEPVHASVEPKKKKKGGR